MRGGSRSPASCCAAAANCELKRILDVKSRFHSSIPVPDLRAKKWLIRSPALVGETQQKGDGHAKRDGSKQEDQRESGHADEAEDHKSHGDCNSHNSRVHLHYTPRAGVRFLVVTHSFIVSLF